MRIRTGLAAGLLLAAIAAPAQAHGLLIPEDRALPPLAMVNHRVQIAIEDQVAVTKVEQTFRNHTDRQLEATYIFPVPKGASVNKFTMWVDGKEMGGEMVKAAEARQIYESIVRRTQDPGLLEYMGNNLLRLRVFPVLPKKDQKVTLSFTSITPQEGGVVEYIYPLKTDGKATRTLEDFSVKATLKSQHPVQNVYSPTHALSVNRISDKEVKVEFERDQALLDKDFQMFYTLGNQEIGVTPLIYRPISTESGHVLLLISPQLAASKANRVPGDMVLVLDTSGSMAGVKMEQAKKALRYCLDRMEPQDRFGLINFSTTVNSYRDNLVPCSSEHIENARKWVGNLKASGGTAIEAALKAALDMRTKDESRPFTIVFFTDGEPTIGERNPDKILKTTAERNTANTRIFTFGVGDDVNATMLDRLAESTRAVSTYVRPAEDIEAKVSSLHGKISHPVLTNLKLTAGDNVRLEEVYPPELPDLFYGTQLVVLAKYTGQGATAVKLTGKVGKEEKEFAYDVTFPARTTEDREFVEHLWARRKVGFLLDQVRANGEKKELIDEIVLLSKKYGIATPYTSYLIVPDAPMPVAAAPRRTPGKPNVSFDGPVPPMSTPAALLPESPAPGAKLKTTLELAKEVQKAPPDVSANRGSFEGKRLKEELEKAANAKGGDKDEKKLDLLREAWGRKQALDDAHGYLKKHAYASVQAGKLGVDLSVVCNNLRSQTQMTPTPLRQAYGRNCLELGGVWIDEKFDAKMEAVVVKAQSDAYFRILAKQPKMKDVYRLGNHVVWVTPNNTALVIDTTAGKDKLDDAVIEKLFTVVKK